jgi:hypothetical protein
MTLSQTTIMRSHQFTSWMSAAVTAALTLAPMSDTTARAATFPFGNNVHGLNAAPGPASHTFTSGEFNLQMSAGPAGAVLRETNGPAGLGVDSSALAPQTTDNLAFSLSVLGGSGEYAGSGEYVEFSFDRPGILTGLNFDGVKDELLEYILLETAGGRRIFFFDSSANMPDVVHPIYQHPLDAAVMANQIDGEVVLLWEVVGLYNDEVYDLNIPFSAGQRFRLTFGAVAPPFAQGPSNGATLQGITVAAVPEPGSGAILVVLSVGTAVGLRRRQVFVRIRHRRENVMGS